MGGHGRHGMVGQRRGCVWKDPGNGTEQGRQGHEPRSLHPRYREGKGRANVQGRHTRYKVCKISVQQYTHIIQGTSTWHTRRYKVMDSRQGKVAGTARV